MYDCSHSSPPLHINRFYLDATELNTKAVPSYTEDKRRLVVVMGLPGSGTQAFAKAMKGRGWAYANEDSEHSSLFFFFLHMFYLIASIIDGSISFF